MVRDSFRDRISLLDQQMKQQIFFGLDDMIYLHTHLSQGIFVFPQFQTFEFHERTQAASKTEKAQAIKMFFSSQSLKGGITELSRLGFSIKT